MNNFLVSGSSVPIVANNGFLVSFLGGKQYVSILISKCSLFVYMLFFCLWSKFPKIVASNFGRCLEIRLSARPGHVAKFPLLVALFTVNLTGLNHVAYKKLPVRIVFFVCKHCLLSYFLLL